MSLWKKKPISSSINIYCWPFCLSAQNSELNNSAVHWGSYTSYLLIKLRHFPPEKKRYTDKNWGLVFTISRSCFEFGTHVFITSTVFETLWSIVFSTAWSKISLSCPKLLVMNRIMVWGFRQMSNHTERIKTKNSPMASSTTQWNRDGYHEQHSRKSSRDNFWSVRHDVEHVL